MNKQYEQFMPWETLRIIQKYLEGHATHIGTQVKFLHAISFNNNSPYCIATFSTTFSNTAALHANLLHFIVMKQQRTIDGLTLINRPINPYPHG